MAKWFSSEDDEAGKAVEAKFTSLETELKATKESSAKTQETLGTLSETIKTMNDRFSREDEARTKAEEKVKADANKEKTQTVEEQTEELLTDPAAYIRKQISGTSKVAIMAVAKQTRQEVLGSEEYYHGSFKKEVDALIESTTDLAQTTNPAYIMNCYKIIKSNHIDEILNGQLKKASSLHSFSDGGTGGERPDKDAKPKVEYRDAKSRYAASQFGLTEDDVIGAANSQAINGLEVVN
jgi:hypothetical protein